MLRLHGNTPYKCNNNSNNDNNNNKLKDIVGRPTEDLFIYYINEAQHMPCQGLCVMHADRQTNRQTDNHQENNHELLSNKLTVSYYHDYEHIIYAHYTIYIYTVYYTLLYTVSQKAHFEFTHNFVIL